MLGLPQNRKYSECVSFGELGRTKLGELWGLRPFSGAARRGCRQAAKIFYAPLAAARCRPPSDPLHRRARVTAPGPCALSSSVRSALSLHAPPLSSGPLSARVRPRCCPHAPPSYGRAGASPTVRVSSLLPPACTPRAPLGAMWVCPTRASRRAPPLVPTSACRSPRASISPRQYVVDLRSLPPNITYRSVVCICLYVKCE
jgi:hypothetical protein